MIDITIAGVSALVLTGILVEVAKRAEIPSKFLPLASLVFGALVVCLGTWSLTIEGVVAGIVVGAISSGVYDNIKKGAELVGLAK